MSYGSGFRTYPLLTSYRWIIFIGPVLMVAVGAFVFFALSRTDYWWWSLLIMALPTLLSIVIAFEFARIRLEIGHEGLRYHAVGYCAEASWPRVSRHSAWAGRLALHKPDIRFSGWFEWMMQFLAFLLPGRAGYALSSMHTVPLRYFDDGSLEASISEFVPNGAATSEVD
jgi:hypothetical protein